MNSPTERTLQVGDGLFDPLRGELALADRTVKLRPRAALLLAYLVRHPGRTIGKTELMQAVWPDVVVTEDSLIQCMKEIRHALGESGHDWIRTVPRLGYAYVADAPPPAPRPQPPAPAPARWRHAAASVGLVLLLLAATAGWRFWPPASSRSAPPPRSFVVLPIANQAGDALQERVAQDITDVVTETFGRGLLSVVAPSTAATYKDQPVDVRALGAQLNVRYVVQGALRKDDPDPVLTLRMAETAGAVQLWQQDLPIRPGWAQHLREDLEGITTSFIHVMRSADARRDGNPDAIQSAELVRQARELLRGPPATTETDRQLQVQRLLEDALRRHDQSASAWAVLAFAYLHDSRFGPEGAAKVRRAAEAAERSVQLAPTSPPALITRGWVYLEEARPMLAMKMFQRALELSPKDAWGLTSRGYGLLHLGRADEALASVRQAMRLSPEDPKLDRWHTYEGMALLHLGQDEAAVAPLARGIRATPPHAFAHLYLASALALTGRIEEARAQVALCAQLHPGITVGLVRAREVSQHPDFLRQRERVYAGLRLAGMRE